MTDTPNSSQGTSDEGQVSEVGRMDPADANTEISDDQGVAGNPDAEDAIEGGADAGPNGKPAGNLKSNRAY
jgi:hypothetical protein